MKSLGRKTTKKMTMKDDAELALVWSELKKLKQKLEDLEYRIDYNLVGDGK